MSNKSSKINVVESPNYRTINVSGGIGSHHQLGIQLVLFSEEFDCAEALSESDIDTKKLGIRRTLECRLSLDPFVAKIIQNLLDTHISKYEEKFGKIPPLDETVDKSDEGVDSAKTNTSGFYT